MHTVRGAMTGCAKMMFSCHPSPVLAHFTTPVPASLSKQLCCGYPLSTVPNQFCLHIASKYFGMRQTRTQSCNSLSPRMAEWKELCGEAQSECRLILVDGKALVYRAYYKNADFESAQSSAFSCCGRLRFPWIHFGTVILSEEDTSGEIITNGLTFRHTAFPEYKSHRIVTPDTVRHAVRDTKLALLGMGIKVVEVPGVEADDVIGTLSLQALEAGMKVRVASQDNDFFQILSPQLRILRFQQKGSGFSSFGVEEFNLRYPGLQISQFVDMRALIGDVSDNIPGVRGIGDVTARKLITQFGTLENLLDLRNEVAQTRARNSLLEDNGQALLSKYLLLLRLDVPEFAMGCSLQNLTCQGPADGGRSFSKLIRAFGAIVGPEVGADISERTLEYWRKLERP